MTPAELPQLPESWLELPDGRTFWLTGRCAIGRQTDNDLVLDLPALSRRHALLTAEAGGYTLSDLHSRNGTFVNRAVITRAYRELLGRDPDPAGYATYEKAMRERGYTERDIRAALMNGDEYKQRQRARR